MNSVLFTGENISIALFFIGLYGVCSRRNILKSIISLSIMQASIILFFLSLNETVHHAPIGKQAYLMHRIEVVADPLPQALMITAIVIGVSVTALCLTLFVSLYHTYGTTNWRKLYDKKGKEGL